ncbi:MAG: lipid A oxidase [Devosia sp.]
MRIGALAAFAALLVTGAAQAGEWELQVGLGMNESAHSKMVVNGPSDSRTYYPGWKGLSFEAPLYYQLSVIYWPDSLQDWGVGVEFNHAKAYADLTDPALSSDFSHLEFSDGLNLLTANVFRKWDFDKARVYVGAGAGIAIPHVEVKTTSAFTPLPNTTTWGYQVGGPAVQFLAGVSYEVMPNWRVFGEGKISYAINDVTLTGGGSLQTNIVSTHLRAGISISLDDGTGW